MDKPKCEVCNQRDSIGGASVPGVPISVAYCKECVQANAHPWRILVANTSCIGKLEDCADWWKRMVEDTCKHLGKTLEEFNKEVDETNKEMSDYFESQEGEDNA